MSIQSPRSVPSSPLSAFPVQSAENVQAIDTPGFPRNLEALDIFFITSSEPSLKNTEYRLREAAQVSGVPMQAMYVEDLTGTSQEEKIDQLKKHLRLQRTAGKIDCHTQIGIHLHGSIIEGPHFLSSRNNEFFIETRELVSLIREVLASPEQNADPGAWKGSVHIGACGVGRASNDLNAKSGYTLLYGGKKVKCSSDSEAIFRGMICRLAEYRRDIKNSVFPTARDFYESASAISGEKVSMIGDGYAFYFRSGYLPPLSALCRPAVMEKLQRSLYAKLIHGKISNVETMVNLLRQGMQDIKIPEPLHVFATVGGSDADEKLSLLVRSGVDINTPIYGLNALQYAIEGNNKEMVRLLLKHGADISKKNDWQASAMSTAVYLGNLDIVEMLIDAGADITDADRNGKTAVTLAFEKSDLRRIYKFSELYFSKTPLGEKIGHVPTEMVLDYLFSIGQVSTYRLLISKSLDPERWTRKLFLMSEHRYLEKLQTLESHLYIKNSLLLELLNITVTKAGARFPDLFEDHLVALAQNKEIDGQKFIGDILTSPGFIKKWSESLKFLSQRLGSLGLKDASDLVDAALTLKSEIGDESKEHIAMRIFVEGPSIYPPLEMACRDNKLAQIKLLHQAMPFVIKAPPWGGKSALMMASEANATEVVRWLLDRGVDPTLNDNQGYSALDYAIAGQHVEVERILRERIGVSASSAQTF